MLLADLPSRPDHPRYIRRLKRIESLLKSRQERLVEEGMILDAGTALVDLWWFCLRFTSFSSWRVTERGHPLRGELWINHPFVFWLLRNFQGFYDEPAGSDFWVSETNPEGRRGWVWAKIHRGGVKSTCLLDSFLWLLAGDDQKTISLVTHQAESIGSGMGKGALAEVENPKLREHFPQFAGLREERKLGFTVDRPPGPRERSLTVASILASPASTHPSVLAFDDAVSDKARNNPAHIAVIGQQISAYVATTPPETPLLVCNAPMDSADPWVTRETQGLFAKVITQSAMSGGDFTPAGQANLHTAAFFAQKRREMANEEMYNTQYELKFVRSAAYALEWAWLKRYSEPPEEIARRSPYINIIIDGAGGTSTDFTVIRVMTWVSHDSWANLDLIREKIGRTAAMQLLLGRDRSDPSTGWIDQYYGKVGIIEKWMEIDPNLVLWFDDHGNQGWRETFKEHCRLRRITFRGKLPEIRRWPEIHVMRRGSEKVARANYTKKWRVRQTEEPYQLGRVWYPWHFGHGSYCGMTGNPDDRDTIEQFADDEFKRVKVDTLPPTDDMLDTEGLIAMPQTQALMRRPPAGQASVVGGVVFPAPTTSNPWGVPAGHGANIGGMLGERTWVSRL